MTFDITTLTINQWIMAGFIVVVSILLMGWICLCFFGRKFRDSIYRDIEDSPRMTRHQFSIIWSGEMYAIGAGARLSPGTIPIGF